MYSVRLSIRHATATRPTVRTAAVSRGMQNGGNRNSRRQRAFFLKNGKPPKKGETLTNPELARTLETVAEGGHAAFYEGKIAETIANHIQELGGCLTVADLKNYRPFITQPYEIRYRGYSVYTAPLGAGGLTTLQMLRLVEEFDMAEMPVAEAVPYLR